MKIKLGPFLMLCVTASVVLMYVGHFVLGLPSEFWDGFCNVVFFDNAPEPPNGRNRSGFHDGEFAGGVTVLVGLIALVVVTCGLMFGFPEEPEDAKEES